LEDVSDDTLRLIVIKERMQELVKIGKWNDKWLFYPFPDMSEPMKAICWLAHTSFLNSPKQAPKTFLGAQDSVHHRPLASL